MAHKRIFGLVAVLMVFGLASFPPGVDANGDMILVLEADGPIAPVMQGYIERGIRRAEEEGAEVLIIELNTPGGNVSITDEIVQDILNTRVPVVVYVAPAGAMAASAGTLITLAGHVAAMAPSTVIGAASPVGLGGEDLGETEGAKAEEVLAATARSLAERRGSRAQRIAVSMVTEARAVYADEALEVGLIDFIARDIPDLIRQLDGFSTEVFGQEVTLHTEGLPVERMPMNWLEKALQVATNPTLVFTLLGLGVILLLVEFSAPGGWLAGTMGFTFLVLAFYGLGVLPINWLGIGFIVLAVVLFVLEAQNPATTGLLLLAGIASMVVGGIVLFSRPEMAPFGTLSIPMVIGEAVILGILFGFVVVKGLQTTKFKPVTGAEGLIGMRGRVLEPLEPEGMVMVAGERWKAISEAGEIEKGAEVEITAVDGLRVTVRRAGD